MATKSTKVGKGTLKSTSGRGIGKPVSMTPTLKGKATLGANNAKSLSGGAIGKPVSLKPTLKGKATLGVNDARSLSGGAIGKPVSLKPTLQGKHAIDFKNTSIVGRGNATGTSPSIKVKFDGSNLKKSFKP